MTAGDIITLIGVVIAVVAIFIAFMMTRWQRDLETLLQLSNHLTDWQGELVGLLDFPLPDPTQLDRFKRKRKYMGPFSIHIARLDARKKCVLFGDKKYKEVIDASICFAQWAVWDKTRTAHPPACAHSRNEAYNNAMIAIAKQVGIAEQSWILLQLSANV